jgi:hypothetical protein
MTSPCIYSRKGVEDAAEIFAFGLDFSKVLVVLHTCVMCRAHNVRRLVNRRRTALETSMACWPYCINKIDMRMMLYNYGERR